MTAFPANITILDGAERTNGAITDGAGADLWQTYAIGGGTGELLVAGGLIEASNPGDNQVSKFEMPVAFDIVLPFQSVPSTYAALWFGLTNAGVSGWEAGLFIVDQSTGVWKFQERRSGTVTDIGSSETVGALTMNQAAGIRVDSVNSLLQAYLYDGTNWGTDPVLSVSSSGDFSGPVAPEFGDTSMQLYSIYGGANGAVSGNTLYVDPDNAGASDSHNYTQAQDPTTPLSTATAALTIVQTGDTIAMVDPADPFPQFQALEPTATDVTIQGADDDATWHLRNFFLQSAVRWKLRNAIPYGDTQGDISSFNACTSLTFDNCDALRGGANILSMRGDWNWIGGKVNAPLDGPALGFLDGVGWRMYPIFEDVSEIGNVTFTQHEFANVQGEDGVQFIGLAPNGDLLHTGTLTFDRCYWHDFTQSDQPNAPHTDGVQLLGANHVIFDSCRFDGLPSMIIATNGLVQKVTLRNCSFRVGGGYATQFFGVLVFELVNNTWEVGGVGGLRIGYDSAIGLINPQITMINNIIDKLDLTEGVGDPSQDQAGDFSDYGGGNLIGIGPARDSDTQGFAEYGHTDDPDDLALELGDPDFILLELANSPDGTNVDAIDTGLSHSDDARVPLLDRLGRSRKGAGTDLGCQESDPDVTVTVDPRAPRVISFSPSDLSTGNDVTTLITVVLFPAPGQTIDESTVTDDSFYVQDSDGFRVTDPQITVGDTDDSGYQTMTLDPAPDSDDVFFQRVQFTTILTTDIQDSAGSALTQQVQSSWRTEGPDNAALGVPGEVVSSPNILYFNGTEWVESTVS